jgi:hypothetical protein
MYDFVVGKPSLSKCEAYTVGVGGATGAVESESWHGGFADGFRWKSGNIGRESGHVRCAALDVTTVVRVDLIDKSLAGTNLLIDFRPPHVARRS